MTRDESGRIVTAAPIAVVQGADAPRIQQCLGRFVERHRSHLRIAGVLEVFDGPPGDEVCKESRLHSIADGRQFTLFQDLGKDAESCALLPEGVVEAGEAVCRDISAGCDLVVLSKFGKLEAENGSGLVAAFAAALEAGVPVLTSVSPRFAEAWSGFAAPLYTVLPCEAEAIDNWWASVAAAERDRSC